MHALIRRSNELCYVAAVAAVLVSPLEQGCVGQMANRLTAWFRLTARLASSWLALLASATFTKGLDKCGFIVEHVTTDTFRSFVRLIDWAASSPTGAEFETRFSAQGNAGKDEQSLRTALRPLLGDLSSDKEVSFYQHFAALNLNGLGEGGALRAEIISRLQEIIVSNVDGQDILLFDRLCRIAREGSATRKNGTEHL
jgi:hypothetical protein